ncbi:MAG: betaine--homocysteine S-methyltransferase [Rhodobacteraceae bacterium]|nr:betaine--homocysteine S-methyltransferase [Paracoccaceae bacterium]
MSEKMLSLLANQGFLLADGATGTNLFNMGLEAGEAPEMWNEQHPDRIRSLYQNAVDAGSDMFLTNSFGGNASRLKLHDAGSRSRELSRIAAEIGRDVADKTDRPIIVAGSMGPTGDLMVPMGDLTFEAAVEIFEEQATGLIEGGADLLWVETMSDPQEFAAAAEAIGNLGASWCGTMSFDTAGRSMMGVTSAALVELVKTLKYQPLGFGANCGVGASDLLRTVLGFVEAGAELPLIAKGNAGIPKFHDGHIHYDGTPELMGEYAVMARNCGAKIIGGCCGTMPDHLRAMRTALDNQPLGQAPSLEEITAKLGAFSSDSDGTGEPAAPRRKSRRRNG